MKTLLVGGFIALSAFAVAPYVPMSEPSLQAEVLNATVRVEFDPASGSGSGTAITKRLILTNHHVIQRVGEKDKIRVRGWVREGDRLLPVVYHAKVVASDEANDLALLKLDADWIGTIGTFADEDPPETTRVCKSGSPLGKRPQVTCGQFAGLDEHVTGGMQHSIHSAATVPGDSGGAVWSAITGRYEIVAVTRAIPAAGFSMITTMGLAVPLDVVKAFVADHV